MALTALVMELGDGGSPEMGRWRSSWREGQGEPAGGGGRAAAGVEIEENVTAMVNVLQEVSRVMAGELGREASCGRAGPEDEDDGGRDPGYHEDHPGRRQCGGQPLKMNLGGGETWIRPRRHKGKRR